MSGFLYTLTLQEPVLANSISGDPNSANSLFYIPGGLIRGAAIQNYAGNIDSDDETFRRIFLDGRTRYLNAYPCAEEGKGRADPTPLKFKKDKYFIASDLSVMEATDIFALDELWQVNVHTQRDAAAGHAREGAGAVYRYIALPAGMTLQGTVRTESPEDAKILSELLDGKTILLGKARTAGYGTALLNTSTLEVKPVLPKTEDDTSFTLTLLSPTIVRNEDGQPTLDLTYALQSRLGVDSLKIEESWQKTETVGGFNRKWGLPLPQVTAIAAGSHFTITPSVSAESLRKLEATGIGERRSEGFGQVAINLPMPTKGKEHWHHFPTVTVSLVKKERDLLINKTAKLMIRRLVRRDLDDRILAAAREMTKDYKGNVPNSQLSRWRVIVRDVLGKGSEKDGYDLQRLKDFCDTSRDKSGWQKLQRARVNGLPFTAWIEKVLEQPEALNEAPALQKPIQRKLGNNEYTMNELNGEYRLRLLDAVLALMEKQNGGSHA